MSEGVYLGDKLKVTEMQDTDTLSIVTADGVRLITFADLKKLAVDSTLSTAGKAADAKETGDAISQLSEEMGNLDVRSIADIKKTASELLVDTYTITYTDGTSSTFQVTNGSSDEAYIASVIRAWLDEHPEATTTVQEGSITEELLHPDLIKKIKSQITDEYMVNNSYKMTWLGELTPAITDYVAWCGANMYDKNIDKYIVFLRCAPAHMHTTEEFYIVYIDRITMKATDPVRVSLLDTDGNVLSFDVETIFNIELMEDGTYRGRKQYNDTWYLWSSCDQGKTWTIGESFNSPSEGFDGIVTLSNGRLITMYGGPIYYSDDNGKNWDTVTPATAGGDYEAEAYFAELEPGTVMAIARYSKAGGEGAEVEPAIISYSYDYGTTWTKWEKSKTITDMNAIGCGGVIHDGYIELFVMSRWYSWLDTYKETGKCGAIYHYIATFEDALNDNFTNLGIVKYADGTASNSAQEFMSAKLCLDDCNGGIFTYCDVGKIQLVISRLQKQQKQGFFQMSTMIFQQSIWLIVHKK